MSRSQPRWAPALVVALMLLGSPGLASAQDRDELQLWTALLGTGDTEPAPPGLSFWLDVHARRGSTRTTVLVRPGIGAVIFDWLSVYGGYAWIPTFDDLTGGTAHEHRLWEQVILQHRFPFGLALQSRTRFEQRFSEVSSEVGFRLRQFVRVGYQPSPDVPLGIVAWDELFVGLNDTDWGAPAGFDQNRLFVGPFLAMAPWARLEAGYLFVYLDRGTSDLYAHVLAVNLFLSLRPPAPAG